MKKKVVIILVIVAALVLLVFLRKCVNEDPENDPVINVLADVQLLAPAHKTQYTVGEDVELKIKINKGDSISDLKVVYDNVVYQDQLKIEDQTVIIKTIDSRVGLINVLISYTDGQGKVHQDFREIVMFSDITPDLKMVNVVAKYPHNPKSYTQGLEFYKGSLYESTGQKQSSYVAEVDYKTGIIKRQVDLDPTLFGEGITILNDTIYELTYQAGICKVYDINFNFIKEFSYTGEGWGLCNNGSQLIMSNGSDEIVWRNRHTFAIEKRIQVYGNLESVVQLNELELIKGRLFANIYTDKRIVEVDTTTGKVLSFIDCNALVIEQPAGVDYFNGIAYNPLIGKIYVTGKWWPSLYEVTFE